MTERSEQWTYAGPRFDYRNGKLFHLWTEADGTEHTFGKHTPRNVYPGNVYDVQVERRDDGGVSLTTRGVDAPKLARLADNALDLKAQSRAAQVQARLDKDDRDEGLRDLIAETLAPLHEVMKHRDQTGRAALLAVVIVELTR